ncbi:distal tail protein Dit [Enterococcus avium]|uniref:distal tail protein Dit n=1 Tax=Enterococcus avium TaxID=33945 RepID=UPI001F57A49A|nr:distal tail protein Dit [Enterococcus avium]
MSYGYFTYNNLKSVDFGLYIDPNFSFSSPSIAGEFVKIPNKDGEVFLTDRSLKNVSRSFPVYFLPRNNENIVQQTTDISNWLKTDIGWKELTFSGDPEYLYSAIYTDEYEVDKNIESFSKSILTFTIKPYKYLKDSLDPIEVTNGQYLTNKGTRPSKPLLRVEGTGDITVKFGSNQLRLKGIDQGIIVDLQAQVVTSLDGSRPAYDRVYTYPFPVFSVGRHRVTWSGNATKVEITPRWEVVV